MVFTGLVVNVFDLFEHAVKGNGYPEQSKDHRIKVVFIRIFTIKPLTEIGSKIDGDTHLQAYTG